MNETFSIKTACPPVSISFCRLIKRKTKIFRPFDRLVLFRLPPPPWSWKLPGTDLELISTKRLPGFLPFFFPSPSFFFLFFFFFFLSSSGMFTKKFGWAIELPELWEGTSIERKHRFRENKDPRRKRIVKTSLLSVIRLREGRMIDMERNDGRSVYELCQLFDDASPKLCVFFYRALSPWQGSKGEFIGARKVFEKTTTLPVSCLRWAASFP